MRLYEKQDNRPFSHSKQESESNEIVHNFEEISNVHKSNTLASFN